MPDAVVASPGDEGFMLSICILPPRRDAIALIFGTVMLSLTQNIDGDAG